MRVLVIGAGLFGTSVATTLASDGSVIDIVDTQDDIMQLASRVNHNRVHLGYHYLRSIQTAEQSIEGLLSFLFNYGEAVVHQFPNYYAIAKEGSKSTPDAFLNFCENVGIGYDHEYPDENLLDRKNIQACFKVPEPVWDYETLKKIIKSKLVKTSVNLFLNTECTALRQLADNSFEAILNNRKENYDVVINTTYSNINKVNAYLGLAKKRLLFEDVIIPWFEYKSNPFGLTIMDGPFCSVMPKGKISNEFLLYHVKESVIQSDMSTVNPDFDHGDREKDDKSVKNIYSRSALFMPFMSDVTPIGYTRTTRTVFENSDDARVTELHTYDGVKNYFTVLSGKVTTCIQVSLEIKHILQGKKNGKRFRI